MGKYYPTTTIFFKDSDKHPYAAYQGQEVKIPISIELKGLDILSFAGKTNFMLRVDADETTIILTNTIDGGTF